MDTQTVQSIVLDRLFDAEWNLFSVGRFSNKELSCLEEESLKDFIHLYLKRDDDALRFYATNEVFGKWSRLATWLLNPVHNVKVLDVNEREGVGVFLNTLLTYTFSGTPAFTPKEFQLYVFQLAELLSTLYPFGKGVVRLMCDCLEPDTSDVLVALRDHFLDMCGDPEVLRFYVGGVSAGVFLELDWDGFKRVVMVHMGKQSLEPLCFDGLIDLNSLGLRQVEFLLEAGYITPGVVGLCVSKSIELENPKPLFLKLKAQHYAKTFVDIYSAVGEFPSMGEWEQYYVWENFNTKENMVRFRELPLYIPLFNLLLLKAGYTGLGLKGKPLKPPEW